MLSAKDLLAPYHLADKQVNIEQAVLLMQNQQRKRQAADLAAGRLVRIAFFDGTTTHTDLYPARVAAFIRRVLGESVSASKGIRFALTSQGNLHQAHYDTKRAGLAIGALICRKRAELKDYHRRMATWHRRLAQEAVAAAQ